MGKWGKNLRNYKYDRNQTVHEKALDGLLPILCIVYVNRKSKMITGTAKLALDPVGKYLKIKKTFCTKHCWNIP